VFNCLDFIAWLILATWVGANGYLSLEWNAVKLLGVLYLDNPGCVAISGQLAVSDFHGYGVFVVKVEAIKDHTPSVFAIHNLHSEG
jgi:hypothetical protein